MSEKDKLGLSYTIDLTNAPQRLIPDFLTQLSLENAVIWSRGAASLKHVSEEAMS